MSTKTKLFVHGFVPEMDEEQRYNIVLSNFSKFGEVTKEDVTLIADHTYGGWRNFCFVEMEPEQAKAALAGLNEFTAPEGITFSISVAKPKTDAPDRGNSRPRTGGGYNKSGGSSYGGGNGGSYGGGNSYGKSSGGYGGSNSNSNNNW